MGAPAWHDPGIILADEIVRIPGMLAKSERAYIHWHALNNFTGQGAAVELGSFLGSSSAAIADGLNKNPNLTDVQRKLHTHDLFIWEQGTLAFFTRGVSGEAYEILAAKNYKSGDSFLDLFQEMTDTWHDIITVYPGDITEYEWQGDDIEFLFVDVMKLMPIAVHVVAEFFTHLVPNVSVVVHQDYCHWWEFWIHLLQYRLRGYLEPLHVVYGAPSVAFRCVKRISPSVAAQATDFENFSAGEVRDAFRWSTGMVYATQSEVFKNETAGAWLEYYYHEVLQGMGLRNIERAMKVPNMNERITDLFSLKMLQRIEDMRKPSDETPGEGVDADMAEGMAAPLPNETIIEMQGSPGAPTQFQTLVVNMLSSVPDAQYHVAGPKSDDTPDSLIEQLPQYTYVAGPWHYGHWAQVPGANLITILHHPVQWAASLFRYHSQNVHSEYYNFIHSQNLSLADFAMHPHMKPLITHGQTMMLAGVSNAQEFEGMSLDELLEESKANLRHLAFFGIDQYPEASLHLFGHTFNWQVPDFVLNLSASMNSIPVSDVDARVIEDMAGTDHDLYAYGEVIFKLQLKIMARETGQTFSVIGGNDHLQLGRARRGKNDGAKTSIPKPEKTCIICAVPRSGSSLITSLLDATRLVGRPDEFFFRENRERLAEKWGISADNFAAFLTQVIENMTSHSGYLIFKIMQHDFEGLLDDLRSLTPDAPDDDVALLESYLASVSFVYITRNDKLRQAISQLKAMQTDIWAIVEGKSVQARGEPAFDYNQLKRFLGWYELWESKWEAFFDAHDIKPLRIVYEDLADSDKQPTIIRNLLSQLGFSNVDDIEVPPPYLKKQADDINEEWVARFNELQAAEDS